MVRYAYYHVIFLRADIRGNHGTASEKGVCFTFTCMLKHFELYADESNSQNLHFNLN